MKKILFKLPEYYLIVLAILAGYSPPFYINPIFIVIAGIFTLQIIFKNKISGISLGILFFLINLYFLRALISEFNELAEFNNKTEQLLFVGLIIWIVNMILSLTMIYKYSTNNFKKGLRIRLEKQSI